MSSLEPERFLMQRQQGLLFLPVHNLSLVRDLMEIRPNYVISIKFHICRNDDYH